VVVTNQFDRGPHVGWDFVSRKRGRLQGVVDKIVIDIFHAIDVGCDMNDGRTLLHAASLHPHRELVTGAVFSQLLLQRLHAKLA
jgi:hypothetical protein